jgi:hypothetical protein
MSYGVPDRGNHAWSIDEEDSRPFIKRAPLPVFRRTHSRNRPPTKVQAFVDFGLQTIR